jgi:hypothetical protein
MRAVAQAGTRELASIDEEKWEPVPGRPGWLEYRGGGERWDIPRNDQLHWQGIMMSCAMTLGELGDSRALPILEIAQRQQSAERRNTADLSSVGVGRSAGEDYVMEAINKIRANGAK